MSAKKPDPFPAAADSAETQAELIAALRAAYPQAADAVDAYTESLRLQAKAGGPLFKAAVLLVAQEFCGEPHA